MPVWSAPQQQEEYETLSVCCAHPLATWRMFGLLKFDKIKQNSVATEPQN